VGEAHETTCAMTEIVAAILPADRPRYLMGVGKPEDIADYVMRGVDLMDCVLPTRGARHGCLFTSRGRLLIRQARYAEDPRPPDPDCSCSVCRRYSRAYLRHLFVSGEMLGPILNTFHNVHFYLERMRALRAAIAEGTVAAQAAQWKQETATAGG
jgi:queuine tRNA-ribosyltransferase